MRKYCSIAKSIDLSVKDVVKPFSEMPGPKGIFGIGNFYNYMKIFGAKYSLLELHHNGMKNYAEYGPIVHEKFLPGTNIVHLFDPDDIQTLFNADGPSNLPSRLSHHALKQYRIERPEIYKTPGLIPTNGEDWWKLRSEAQKDISIPKAVRNILPDVDQTTQEFVANVLPSNCDENGIVHDMTFDLHFLSFEILTTIIFGERFDGLSKNARDPNSFAFKIIQLIEGLHHESLPLDRGILWRFFKTPMYKSYCEKNDYLHKVSIEIIQKKLDSGLKGESVIDKLLKRPTLDIKDVNGLADDFFLAGIDTTATTTSMALYHLSKNPQIQDKIYEEAVKALPSNDDPITNNIMNSEIPYLRAVLKESTRFNPISIGIGRLTNHDMVLGGYNVPKNTIIVTGNMVACRQEKNFKNALEFIPERWLGEEKKKIHPYLLLPFGHGMRSCIARRFAEQGMLVTLLRILRNYKFEWKGKPEPLDIETKLLNYPKDKVVLKFIKR